MRAALLAGLLALSLAVPVCAAGPGFAPIDVRTMPISAFARAGDATRFGDLEFRGGLELLSLNRDLGSLSGIDYMPDGVTLVAVADTGMWFEARVVETEGRLTGVADTRIAAMLMDNGKPPETKIAGDAEGLRVGTRDGVPTAFVSFEQTAAVRAFAGPDFASATPARIKLPGFVKGIRRNQGLESIAIAPGDGSLAGALVVIAERSLDENGNHRAFILSGPNAGGFAITRSDDFDVTDAAFLPGGDLLILERRFSFSGGLAVRLRRIASTAIAPGVLAKPATIMESGTENQIDNLEGLAVRVIDGETRVTLISDNNGNMLQRTLLLEFVLLSAAATSSGPAITPLPNLRPAP